jgi:hypothetical protein
MFSSPRPPSLFLTVMRCAPGPPYQRHVMPKARAASSWGRFEARERTLQAQGDFEIERVIGGQVMIAADCLHDSAYLVQ